MRNSPLLLHPPQMAEKRGEFFLFVWGDIGQWISLDSEAAELLNAFRQPTDATTVVERLVTTKSNSETYSADAKIVINQLQKRGILYSGKEPPRPSFTEPLSLANITYNITNQCNLRCPWCYNHCGNDVEPVNPEQLSNWLRQGQSMLDSNASFFILGGEPFLNQRKLANVIHAVRPFIPGEILISTNGTFTPTIVNSLSENCVTVQISLDSPLRSQHDSLRGKGVFDKAMQTARELVRHKIYTVFSMVMQYGEENSLEAYFELALQLGVNEVRFIPMRRIGKAYGYNAPSTNLVDYFTSLVKLLKQNPQYKKMLRRDYFSILAHACSYSHLRENCGIGRRVLFINADGKLYPCPNHTQQDHCCGNIRHVPLDTILESDSMKTMRKFYCMSRLQKCSQCLYRFWCTGDCRAEAATQSIGAPSPYCADIHTIIKELLWMSADNTSPFTSPHIQHIC